MRPRVLRAGAPFKSVSLQGSKMGEHQTLRCAAHDALIMYQPKCLRIQTMLGKREISQKHHMHCKVH